MLYGIDHASHQGHINMALLRDQGHSFEIGKCTGEGNYVNPYYAPNHQRAVAAGIVTGSYDWVEPQDAREPEWLADDYLRCVDSLGGRPLGHLLTVDFETPDWFHGPRGRNIHDFMRRYLYRLKEKSGQPVGVYTAPYFLQETGAIGWDWLGRDFWYWLAAPGSGMVDDNAPWHGSLGPPWSKMTIHQHQWHARSAAIGSGANFDRNRFNGTLAQLQALGNGGGGIPKKEGNVPERLTIAVPPDGKWSAEVIGGKPVLVMNFGGQVAPDGIVGVDIPDAGMTVKSSTEAGVTLSASFKDEVYTGYRENR